MASAAPILGQMLVGQVVSRIGENQGWNPMVTAGLGMLAGSATGSGLTGAMATRSASQPGGLLWQSPDAFGAFDTANVPYLSDASIASAANPAFTAPSKGEFMLGASKDTFKNMWNDKEFATSMGSQFIDAAFKEEPPVQHQATGGGGASSSPLGSPYQGGNGVSGQYKLTSGMPGRAQGIQWKGI